MTLILTQHNGDNAPNSRVAVNPLQIESAEQQQSERTLLTFNSGRRIVITEPFDVYLVRWMKAVEDIQQVAEWDPSEDEIEGNDEADDLADCLS